MVIKFVLGEVIGILSVILLWWAIGGIHKELNKRKEKSDE